MALTACLVPPPRMCDKFDEITKVKIEIEKKKFPDGEVYVRIPEPVAGESVVVVHTGFPDQNDRMIEIMLVVDTLKDLGAEQVTLVMPYFPYARQDRRFREGEPISIKTMLKTLSALGLDNLIVVNIHKEYSLQYFKGTSVNINVLPFLAKTAAKDLSNVLVMAPDKGATQYARAVAKELGAEWDYLEKFRDRITGEVIIKPKEIDVSGRDVIIIDDMVSTGGTLALATSELRKRGARSVRAVVAHALLIGDAIKKLKEAGLSSIVTANTLAREYPDEFVKVVDVSELVINELKNLGVV